jgi:hypothetical protein
MTKIIKISVFATSRVAGSGADDQENDPHRGVQESVRVEKPDAAGDVRPAGSKEAKQDKLDDPGDDQEHADALYDGHEKPAPSRTYGAAIA